MITEATRLGMATVVGAFTPTEVESAWALSPTAVQILPADQVDPGYTGLLETEIGEVPLIATGRIDAAETERWIAGGAVAVTPTVDLVGNALSGGVLMGLRIRSRDYASAVTRARN